ncbi:MAG: hypothetical protein QM754_19295 [Tepidisphaeraceae bacterium]
MSFRAITLTVLASVACGCATESKPHSPTPTPKPTTFASQQDELAYLRAENARLRGEVADVTQENTQFKTKAEVAEARNKQIESGKLEVGMTLPEASKAINGSPKLYKETVQLVSETETDRTYRILTGSQMAGPGSGGAAAVGTNMRRTCRSSCRRGCARSTARAASS